MEDPGELVAGRFRLEREVGRGGVGTVYRAQDVVTRRPVAFKIITVTGVDAGEQQRLSREGQILSELDHPSIVRVVAFGTLEKSAHDPEGRKLEEGAAFVAMEWLEGEDLQARQRREQLSLHEALKVGRQVAGALAAAHEAGVVHRDIKPSNIIVQQGPEGAPLRVKLVDFGVAVASKDVLLTSDNGGVVGTPAYMAPEQARGDATADARSDLYSLGATLFELIAGRPPHMGPTSIATLVRLATTPAPRLSELFLDVPSRLDDLIHSLLLADRELRPSSAREVMRALEEIGRDPNLPSLSPAHTTEPPGTVLGTRLVTTIVALHVATGDARQAELDALRAVGADALPLGADSVVAHLGVRRAYGQEAVQALDLAMLLAARGGKVGVASGRMRVERTRSAGEVVDRAVALARGAAQGRTVADATTVELTRGRFLFEPRLPARGGEVLHPLPRGAMVVVGHSSRPREGQTPFVGREAEIITATTAFERCVEDRTPLVVTVSGPPGIGKSRLARELVLRVVERAERPRVVQLRCEAFGRAQVLGVAADLLRALMGLPKGATVEAVEKAVRARKLRHDDQGMLPLLLANQPFPEGMDVRGAREALYLSMTELSLVETTSPRVLLVEDAQWADPESVAWLDHLLGRAAGLPLFLMLMVRPAFWRDEGQRFVGRDHVRIELRPMAKRATREIARAVIGAASRSSSVPVSVAVEAMAPQDDALLDQIAQQAAGSPLFAEELARVIAAGKDAATAPTIEAAIQVSLDALDDVTREAVVRMSVFGLSVWDKGLNAVGVRDPAAGLRRSVASELLVEQGGSRFPGTREYLFKHALVRDVAYASLGDELQKELHRRAARWLYAMGEDSATVAQHLDLGGEHEEAASHWESAARRALATNALKDAAMMAERAYVFATDKVLAFGRAVLMEQAHSRLDGRSSEREAGIRAMSENVYDEASELLTQGARARYEQACGAGGDVEARLVAVRDRSRELGLVDEVAQCSAVLAHCRAFAGQFQLAEQEAEHLLKLAEQEDFVWAAVDAWQTRAVVHQARGEVAAALEARRNAARAARAAGLQEREAVLTMNVGFALTTMGARREALQEVESGIARAQEIGSAGAVRNGQMILLCWTSTFGPDPAFDVLLAEPRSTADEAAGGMWVVRDRVTLGVLFYRGVELLRGDPAGLTRARSLLKLTAEAYRSTDNRDVLPVALGFWAEAERRFGKSELAAELAREAAALVEAGEPSLLNEAPIYLALHDACVDLGDLPGARAAVERAMQPLLRRVAGLEGTPYARSFLFSLPQNAALLTLAETYGCTPHEIEAMVTRDV
ncbi:serine/threonine-protein kinase PknK [Chondromyces crocatus]|uniref:Protein kinase n=1 Tax=Chondromyces crocatus TaxID=52 RepID=A0A0K1ELE5_CHOCO|nr:serine/threonine-protein kinase [Chondromyces crocatus]AKT41621.1 protein kinase [Chondromyces crocatus]